MEGDDNWLEVAGKMRKARNIWMRMTRILIREGDYLQVLGLFFKTVLQAVLILELKTWVLNPRMKRALSSFQNRVAQPLTRRQLRRRGEVRW